MEIGGFGQDVAALLPQAILTACRWVPLVALTWFWRRLWRSAATATTVYPKSIRTIRCQDGGWDDRSSAWDVARHGAWQYLAQAEPSSDQKGEHRGSERRVERRRCAELRFLALGRGLGQRRRRCLRRPMRAGDIGLVRFPFSAHETQPFKQRPVLALGSQGAGSEEVISRRKAVTSSAIDQGKRAGWERHPLLSSTPSRRRSGPCWASEAPWA